MYIHFLDFTKINVGLQLYGLGVGERVSWRVASCNDAEWQCH
jgi:hypothetical protein